MCYNNDSIYVKYFNSNIIMLSIKFRNFKNWFYPIISCDFILNLCRVLYILQEKLVLPGNYNVRTLQRVLVHISKCNICLNQSLFNTVSHLLDWGRRGYVYLLMVFVNNFFSINGINTKFSDFCLLYYFVDIYAENFSKFWQFFIDWEGICQGDLY